MASYVLKKKGLFTTYVRTALASRHVFTQNGTTPLPKAEYLIHLPGKKMALSTCLAVQLVV